MVRRLRVGGIARLGSLLGLAGCGDDVSPSSGTTSPSTSDGSTSEGDDGATGAVDCADGEVRECPCPGDLTGEQVCVDGAFGTCACPASEDSTGTPPTDDTSDTGEPARTCGDGVVDEGEQCDDGDDDDTNACSNACVPHCGVVWQAAITELDVESSTLLADGSILVHADSGD